MDPALRAVIELNEFAWTRLKEDLKHLSSDEVNWRPLPQANSINLIVRHLRIEAEWKLTALQTGEPEPHEVNESVQRFIDSIGFDYETNFEELDALCTQFIAALHEMDERTLLERTQSAYAGGARPSHFLGLHHPAHMLMHWGQVRTVRTLYKKTRGEPVPPQFFPDNPSYPRSDIG